MEVWFYANSSAACSYAKELPAAADKGLPISFRQLYQWNTKTFREAHRVPMVQSPAGGPTGKLVKVGKIRDWEWPAAELRRIDGLQPRTRSNLWITIEPGHTIRVYDEDEDLIQRFVAAQYGAIEWEAEGHEVHVARQGT